MIYEGIFWELSRLATSMLDGEDHVALLFHFVGRKQIERGELRRNLAEATSRRNKASIL